MNYDFVPLPSRKPPNWPNHARLALIVTINVEYWDLLKDTEQPYYAGGPSILPDPLPGNVADFPNYTWREYGQRVGVWRMIEAFDEAGVPASITINAKVRTGTPSDHRHGQLSRLGNRGPQLCPVRSTEQPFLRAGEGA